jgi:hypothetical protein
MRADRRRTTPQPPGRRALNRQRDAGGAGSGDELRGGASSGDAAGVSGGDSPRSGKSVRVPRLVTDRAVTTTGPGGELRAAGAGRPGSVRWDRRASAGPSERSSAGFGFPCAAGNSRVPPAKPAAVAAPLASEDRPDSERHDGEQCGHPAEHAEVCASDWAMSTGFCGDAGPAKSRRRS